MHWIKIVLQQQPNSYHNILMWTTCCLASLVFYAVISSQSFWKETMIQPHTFHTVILEGMTVIISFWLWFTSKIQDGPFLQRDQHYIGVTQNEICPVKVLMLYLARRGSQAGPLLICENQRFLTQQAFQSHLIKLLQHVNLDPSCYNTHSFRIG